METTDLVTVGTFPDETEARIAQDALVAAGIRGFLQGAESNLTMLDAGAAPSGVRLLVEPGSMERAREVLHDADLLHREGHGWTCAACGASVVAEYEVCWSCGAIHEQLPQPESPSGSSERSRADRPADHQAAGPLVQLELYPELDERILANDGIAQHALRAAAFSLLFPPVLVYAVVLIIKTAFLPLSSRGARRFLAAFAISLLAGLEWTVLAIWLR